MIISRAVVVAVLRERGLNDRADFVEHELPEQFESARHSGLLSMLRIDPAELAEPADPASS